MALLDYIKKGRKQPVSNSPLAENRAQEASAELADERVMRWEKVVEHSPNEHTSVIELCNALNEAKRLEDADKLLTQLVAEFPDERAVLYAVARQHLRTHRNEEALAAWIEIDKLWPSNVEPLQNIGALMIRCGKAEQSLDIAAQLSELDDGRSERLLIRAYRKMEDYDNLITQLNQASARRRLDADESAAKIFALLNVEGYDAAIAWARSARDDFPENKSITVEFASLLSMKEKFSEALDVLDSHAHIMDDPSLHAPRRTTLLVKLGRFDEADMCAEQALIKSPNDKDLLLAHARIAQARFSAIRRTA